MKLVIVATITIDVEDDARSPMGAPLKNQEGGVDGYAVEQHLAWTIGETCEQVEISSVEILKDGE